MTKKETAARNRRIVKWLSQGKSYRFIAEKENISSGRVHQLVVHYELYPVGIERMKKIVAESSMVVLPKVIPKVLPKVIPAVIKIKPIEKPVKKPKEKNNISIITGIKSCSRDQIRELVRIRDKHTCQICSKVWTKGTRRFDVHHVDENLEGTDKATGKFKSTILYDRDNMDKMITYCHKCHLGIDTVRNKMSLARREKWLVRS